MVTILVHCIIIILGPSLIGSTVDSLHQWSLSVCMLSTMNPCLWFILVQQGIFHFIILNLRLRCRSTRCDNTRSQALTQPSLATESQRVCADWLVGSLASMAWFHARFLCNRQVQQQGRLT